MLFNASQRQSKRVLESYGVIHETLHWLSTLERLCYQAMNRFAYKTAMSRSQTRLHFRATLAMFRIPHAVFVYDLRTRQWRTYGHADLDAFVRRLAHTVGYDTSTYNAICIQAVNALYVLTDNRQDLARMPFCRVSESTADRRLETV